MDNQPPVPKPRTKFIQETKDEAIDNEINESLENAPLPTPLVKPTPPALPPRPPPAKPPRSLTDAIPPPSPSTTTTTPPPSMSPPSRQAPPPPRPTPPDVGWKPEIIEEAKVQQIMSRPLPATPLEVTIENPVYLGLGTFRAMSGLTPISDEVDQLREWLSEEDFSDEKEQAEEEKENQPSTSTAIPVEVRHSEIEDNPYTPCPRRNDFPSSSTSSRQSHNLYVSPNEIFLDQHIKQKPVVESCSSSNSDLAPSSTHPYVNISKNESSSSLDEKDSDVKIDGSTVTFVGFVSISSFRKDKRVHCRLRNMQISFHEDEETSEYYQGPFDIKDIYTFRIVKKKENSHFMDIASTSSPQPPPPPISCIQLFYGEKRHNSITFCPEDAASLWMLLLSEAWLSTLHGVLLSDCLKNARDLSIFGNIWVREGTTGEWTPAAAGVFDNKTFCYCMTDEKHRVKRRASAMLDEINEVDLRKSSRVQEKVDKSQFCPNLKHRRGPFSISLNSDDSALFRAYFIDSKDDSSTSAWFETIDELLKRPASRLEDYRLTSDDIPVIVDKCLRFVDAYGVKSEGIYRRNGKVSEAKTILTKLIEDPVGYHIKSENNETVYAVADVLRQFFRKLDLPLILCEVQPKLFEISKIDTPTPENLDEYSRIIGELPTVHQSTLKKCIAHLKNVHDHMEDNKASVENLAKIFGASLFSTDTMPQPCFTENYNDQINVIRHFINNYDLIFHISSQEEISRQLIKEAEKKTRNNQKFGAELMVPIHMWEKDNLPFNVKVGLAGEEVCREAIAKNSFDAPRNAAYSIFEVLGEGQLLRRVAASEKLSKIVMRWIGWKCTNAYLLFDHDKYRFDGNDMSSFTGKVKMAEPGSKTFKSYEMKIEKGVSVLVYRNEKLYKTWSLDDIDWFVGAETSRKAPNHFNTTMLNSDGYCSRLPGYCISFKEEDERTRWLNAVNYAKTGGQPESLVFI